MRFFFSFCLDLKCAKLRAKKNYLMEGVSQVMTSEEEVEKSGLVTEYRTFLCVLTLPAITIDCWLLWQFYTQGFSSWCLIWIRLLLAGLCHGVPKEKRGFALWNADRRSIPVQVSGFGSIAAQKWFSGFSLACCYSYDHQSFQTGLKERDGEWVERLLVITGKLSSYGQLSLLIRVSL